MEIKLVTFNIHHGKQPGVKYSTKKLCEDAKSLDADVICLQEADVLSVRTYLRNQPRVIAKYLGYFYSTVFVRFYGGGFQCNSIISKYPIISSDKYSLPKITGKQKRAALKVVLKIEDKNLIVLNTHLNSAGKLRNENKTAQDQLIYLMNQDNDKIIIAGDLNMLPERVLPIVNAFEYMTKSRYPASPASHPKDQIDWIITKGYVIENMSVSPQLCSDHRALSADINI